MLRKRWSAIYEDFCSHVKILEPDLWERLFLLKGWASSFHFFFWSTLRRDMCAPQNSGTRTAKPLSEAFENGHPISLLVGWKMLMFFSGRHLWR